MVLFIHKLLVLPTAVLRDTHRALAQAEPEVAAVVLGDDDAALQELLKEAYAVSISWHPSPTCTSVSQVTRWPAHVCAQLPKVLNSLSPCRMCSLDVHELFNEIFRRWAGGEEASRAGKQAAGGAHN